jgi:hypothetical protein
MRLVFTIPLLAGLLAGYIARKSEAEIAYLTSVLAIVSLLISLLMAPWQLQFLLLLVVFAIVRQFWLKIESQSQLASSQAENDRMRQYRGVTYEQDSPAPPATSNEKIQKHYRGVSYEANTEKLSEQPAPLPKSVLKYRGVSIVPPTAGEKKLTKVEPKNDPT